MNSLQKKFILTTVFAYLFALCFAWLMKSQFVDLYNIQIFFHLFVRYDFTAVILLLIILFAGIILAKKDTFRFRDEWLHWFDQNIPGLILFIFLLLLFGAYFIYHHYPLSMDEYLQYFQAQIFADGRLWGQYPKELVPWLLEPDFFSVFSSETGRVVSNYWPGLSLLLTPFMKIGAPWLLNPILSAGSLALLFYYSRRILKNSIGAAWTILLTVSSAVFLVNGISYYSMSAHLFMNLLFAICLLKITPVRLFSAGLVGSVALVLHNPIPHIAFAIPWIIWIVVQKNRVRNITLLFAGYLPVSAIIDLGWFWIRLFIESGGEVLTNVGSKSQQTSHLVALVNLFNNINLYEFITKITNVINGIFKFPEINTIFFRMIGWLKMFAWSLPGLPILAILGIRYINGHTHLKLWGWSAISTLFIFVFVPFSQSYGWGFRYFFPTWFALPLLGAAFLSASELKQSAFWKKFILIAALLSFILVTSLRFYQVNQYIGEHLSQLPEFEEGTHYVCIMQVEQGYYVQDMIQNSPFLKDPVIMLKSLGTQNDLEMMKRHFPGAIKVEESQNYSLFELPNH